MEKRKINPKVTLVGAGPGDPELISVKGAKVLTEADVVLYDALVNQDLLLYAPATAEKIYVGKRSGSHTCSQDEINKLIVQYAYSHGHVVRLKGGDSFVFGRGHEEITYVESFGIETQIVPGISSSIAVPELQKIPLTKRGVNESFWVVTGTTSSGTLSEDIPLAAKSSATVIILMGMSKLNEIVAAFTKEGKKNTPAAVIQHGSLPDEKIAIGSVKTIADAVKENKVGPPAVIIIGEVVAEHPHFNYALIEKLVSH